MKKSLIRTAFIVAIIFQFAEVVFTQEKFDIMSFQTPKGWNKEVQQNAVQFSTENKTTQAFCIMLLFKSLPAGNDSKTNFNASWKSIVKDSFDKVGNPQMQATANENGWNIETGSAQYENEGIKGAAVLVTASSGGRAINLLILTNSDEYESEITEFMGSMVLPRGSSQNASSNMASNAANVKVAGLWTSYINETSGYVNGFPQTTGGYFRKEYRFNSDGSYVFREKNFPALSKTIVFKQESGTWSVNGDKLTVSPSTGKVETWGKSASGRNDEWGKLLRSDKAKLEKITYSFELKYLSGMEQTYLVLSYASPTERDGRQSNNDSHLNQWQYSAQAVDKPLIDTPPR